MTEMLGAVGLIAFAVSSLAIGVRLLMLGRRTRGIPELAIGLGFRSNAAGLATLRELLAPAGIATSW